jgi:hypothetical protein
MLDKKKTQDPAIGENNLDYSSKSQVFYKEKSQKRK